jgi:hypothetical protein
MYTLYNVHVLTPTCSTIQYVISCCEYTATVVHMLSYYEVQTRTPLILNDIGRNSLLGNRKKIAKFLMKTFTCRSTFLYGTGVSENKAKIHVILWDGVGWECNCEHMCEIVH